MPPADDDEARTRIIQAARDLAQRDGLHKTNIKKIAERLKVTRQTIYRLYSSSDELLAAVSIAVGGRLLEDLLLHAEAFDTFSERVVESIIFLALHIPMNACLRPYFSLGEGAEDRIQQAFSEDALRYSLQMLKALVPRDSTPPDETVLKPLAEHMQRILLSLIIAPTANTATADGMRVYLNVWLKPLVAGFDRRA